MTEVPLDVVRWAADECQRQRSGEASVTHMVEAWLYACRHSTGRMPDVDDILALGRLVEPVKNRDGFRRCGVRVGNDVKMDWRDVPASVDVHVAKGDDLDCYPDDQYRRFEEIHPFVDGNGRTGSILWNWWAGTLAEPCDPPNFWDYDMYWNTPRKVRVKVPRPAETADG